MRGIEDEKVVKDRRVRLRVVGKRTRNVLRNFEAQSQEHFIHRTYHFTIGSPTPITNIKDSSSILPPKSGNVVTSRSSIQPSSLTSKHQNHDSSSFSHNPGTLFLALTCYRLKFRHLEINTAHFAKAREKLHRHQWPPFPIRNSFIMLLWLTLVIFSLTLLPTASHPSPGLGSWEFGGKYRAGSATNNWKRWDPEH